LLSPLPNKFATDSKYFSLESREVKIGSLKLPCVMLVPKFFSPSPPRKARTGEFTTFCFDPHEPALLFTYWFGQMRIEYNRTAEMQQHYLPLDFRVMEGSKEIFSAIVTHVDNLSPQDPELAPAKGAKIIADDAIKHPANVKNGRLIKGTSPIYPLQAQSEGKQGTVALAGTIGTDGRVQNLEVVASPSPLLTKAAEDAVQQWRYKPYTVDGKPVEVYVTFRVLFLLRHSLGDFY
jgi:TonB family protein